MNNLRYKISDEMSEEYFGVILNFIDEIMRQITFGMFDENGDEILSQDDYYELTRIQSPEHTINSKKGNSVDQTNLIYWLAKDNGLKPDIYYIEYTNKENISPSHMFVLFNHNDNVYWYENILKEEKGLHNFKDLPLCLDYIKSKFCPIEYADTCKVYKIKELKEGTNPNKVLSRKYININDKPKLYMITEKELDCDKELLPTIPNNFLTEYGYSDIYQERLTFFPTIENALYSDSYDNLKNKVYNVYSPIYNCELYRPKTDEVPTSDITKEVWIKEPVKVKKVGKIKVGNSIPETLSNYKFGTDNIGKLKTWSYEVVEGSPVIDSVLNRKRTYYVIDSNKKILFEDNYDKCNDYIKKNSFKNVKCIMRDLYSIITDKELDYLFKDKEEGLKIMYINDNNHDYSIVKVIDCKTKEILDSETCYDKDEARYIINFFRQQYKIRKVEKSND